MLRKFLITNKIFKLSKSTQLTAVRLLATKESCLEQSLINDAIQVKPALSIYKPDEWRQAHETFQNHGLHTQNFLRIVIGNPTLLKRPSQRIVESLEIWRACQFGEHFLHLLLTKYPELLDVGARDTQRLLSHIAYLKSRVTTSKNVWKLLMNSPDLLAQKEDAIEEKFNYMQNEMRIEIPEIVKSAALSLPLDDLRCRHTFLVRLGLFKPRPIKADPDEKTSNNRLYQVTDTSEKTFATKICHVTLGEYEAFKELFARELERGKKRSHDDEELSDDD